MFYRTVMDSNREPVKVEGPPGSKVFIYQEVSCLHTVAIL